MISEIRKNVKSKIISIVSDLSNVLSVPGQKYLLEVIIGIIGTKSCNLTHIAGFLNEEILIRDTVKRLRRNTSRHKNILNQSNIFNLSRWQHLVTSETIIALDGGDIIHKFGHTFEFQCRVKDGSTGNIENGYYLNQVSCYNPSSNRTFPGILDVYSTQTHDFKSANTESIKLIDQFVSINGKKGLWVLDRGYDGNIIFQRFFRKNQELDFVVRMKKTRNLIFKGSSVNIKLLAKQINRRYNNGKHHKFGYEKCFLQIDDKAYPVTLIAHKGEFNKEVHMFLTNGHICKSAEIRRRIEGYYHRWGVEECYRFEKQGFGIEKAQVRSFDSLKTLIGVTMLAWSALLMVEDDKLLKENVIHQAKREKQKLKHRPDFIYYTLLDGIRNAFAGAKNIYKFRKTKKPRWLLSIEDFLPKSSLRFIY